MKEIIKKVNQKDKTFFPVGFYKTTKTPIETCERNIEEMSSTTSCEKLKTTKYILHNFYKQI